MAFWSIPAATGPKRRTGDTLLEPSWPAKVNHSGSRAFESMPGKRTRMSVLLIRAALGEIMIPADVRSRKTLVGLSEGTCPVAGILGADILLGLGAVVDVGQAKLYVRTR